MKILNFGSCNIDYVYSLDHIVAPGETESTYNMEVFPGGKGLNQSIAAAKAGAEVYHAGCIGADGQMLRDLLAENGVDVSLLKTVDGKNGHAIIQLSAKGENCIFLYPGSNEMLTESFIDEVLEKFSEEDVLLLQNEVNNVDYMVKKAHEKGMKIVLNPSPYNERLAAIDLNMLSYIILNEVEARDVTGLNTPEECLAAMRKQYPGLRIMLTLGKKGCIYQDNEQTLVHPAFHVDPVVDTTAAGDTFTGYFLASVAKGQPCGDAIRIATAASALAVSRKGAAPSIPYAEEVRQALAVFKLADADRADPAEQQRKQIDDYLNSDLCNASITGLAQALGYSSVYVGDLVKQRMNKSFTKLLQDKRCAVAAQMLLETDRSVEDIISAIGYKNQSFFREHFKEKYGKSPREYRKLMRGEKHDK